MNDSSCKCAFPEGMTILLDGVHELDPCIYRTKEIHRNVTVKVCQCPKCGSVEVLWYRQEDTEDEIIEEMEDPQ